MKKWKSHAEWPQVEGNHIRFSEDEHDTVEQAQAVCELLKRDGLGGDRKIFPVQTWVTRINWGGI